MHVVTMQINQNTLGIKKVLGQSEVAVQVAVCGYKICYESEVK